jgi:tRNA(adenine34) deaminase
MTESNDLHYMNLALSEAKMAYQQGEVPVGAVICDSNGLVVSTAHNLVESDTFAGAHAELLAIRTACQKTGSWRLPDFTLYVTLEPCPMCISLCVLSRLKKVVFGCQDPRMGACGSLFSLACHPELPHQLDIQGGILEDECREMLESFFQGIRTKSR